MSEPEAQRAGDTVSRLLRTMTSADIDAVLGLEQELFGEEAWSQQMLEGELAEQPRSRYYLVAAVDGLITGYAGLLVAGTQADVLTIAVAADRWGRGTGSALLEELLAEAARRGCTEVFLEVRTDNMRAQRLYRRYGFVEIGIRKGYYQPSGADALVMRRDSADPGGRPPGPPDGASGARSDPGGRPPGPPDGASGARSDPGGRPPGIPRDAGGPR